MGFTYAAALLLSLGGLALADWRWRLVFWRDPFTATVVMSVGVVALLTWDLVCVALGVFHIAPSPWATGWLLIPGIPIEEPFFLMLLCYTTLMGFRGVEAYAAERRKS